MDLDVADQQILRGVTGTLEWVNVDGDGEPVEAGGAVTVTVVNAAGTTILSSGSATLDSETPGRYTRSIPAASTASVDWLTATWVDAGDSSSHTTTVEIVGGYLFSAREAKDHDLSLTSIETARIVEARAKVTEEVEWICDRAFTPRYRRITLDGNGDTELALPVNDIRSVRSVTVDGTAYTAGEVAALIVREGRSVEQPDGSMWPMGQNNVVIGVEFGLSRPHHHLKEAVLNRFRQRINSKKSGIPDRATSWSAGTEGGTYSLDKASRYKVGYPDIDAVYARFSLRSDDDGARAYNVQVDQNPQYGSLFHGGRR